MVSLEEGAKKDNTELNWNWSSRDRFKSAVTTSTREQAHEELNSALICVEVSGRFKGRRRGLRKGSKWYRNIARKVK